MVQTKLFSDLSKTVLFVCRTRVKLCNNYYVKIISSV